LPADKSVFAGPIADLLPYQADKNIGDLLDRVLRNLAVWPNGQTTSGAGGVPNRPIFIP
jgi:hypothetical protein